MRSKYSRSADALSSHWEGSLNNDDPTYAPPSPGDSQDTQQNDPCYPYGGRIVLLLEPQEITISSASSAGAWNPSGRLAVLASAVLTCLKVLARQAL